MKKDKEFSLKLTTKDLDILWLALNVFLKEANKLKASDDYLDDYLNKLALDTINEDIKDATRLKNKLGRILWKPHLDMTMIFQQNVKTF